MLSRLAGLLRSREFGIYFPGPKQDAILREDLSGTVVHPFFVHAMGPFGMYFCADVGDSPRMIRSRAKHAQRTFELIAEMSIGNDVDLLVQVLFSMASMSLHARFLDFSRHNLKKACIALNAATLRFIPDTGRPPELTEEVRERAVVLSQIIFLENYMFLAVDGIEVKMAARIEEEFRQDLQVGVHFHTSCGVYRW